MFLSLEAKSEDYILSFITGRTQNFVNDFMQKVLKPENHMLFAENIIGAPWPPSASKLNLSIDEIGIETIQVSG